MNISHYSHKATKLFGLCLLSAALTACAGGGLISTGNQSTAMSGSAGGSTSVGANPNLERCDRTLGTIAIDDGRNADWYGQFGSATQVTSIEPLLRLAVQQSNCFVITSIGNQQLDSRLSQITDQQRNSGEYRAGSNQHKGQRVAADYFLEPKIIINNDSVGGVGSTIGGLLGNSAVAGLAGAMQSKASVVTLSLFDIRSSVQISTSEGSATATNYGAAIAGLTGSAAGGLSGFSRTPEGKATVAAFNDAWNKMIVSLKNYRAQEVEGGLGTGGVLRVN
ncbi:MAG: hypothetical protein E6Q71_04630 [Pseudomonas sp.]|nr:MAG: hypothetical protein E6Q71_04630 [Pseudomonas sp.]